MKGYINNMPNKVTKEPNRKTGTWSVKSGLAQMLKGGVIMDVVTADQAKIAEDAGAVAVMALERVPSDIRKAGGVARMADPTKITEIIEAVSIPVMAKCRIGHFVEAQILESLDVDYIDESEVLTPADENNHINKTPFKVPFVCGARDLGEALRRIGEGAAMVRTKGEAGTGNIVEAVRHARSVLSKIKEIQGMDQSQLMAVARDLRSPFVGSGIFKSENPDIMANAIVKATTHFNNPDILADISRGLGTAMPGLDIKTIPIEEQLSTRGW